MSLVIIIIPLSNLLYTVLDLATHCEELDGTVMVGGWVGTWCRFKVPSTGYRAYVSPGVHVSFVHFAAYCFCLFPLPLAFRFGQSRPY